MTHFILASPLMSSVATLAISTIFVVWQNYHHCQVRRERVKRERVTYLLWSAAQSVRD